MARYRYVITLFLACASAWQARAQTPEKLPVVATFSILADFAPNVGGERIEVTALVGPNGDTHVYQPKPADAKERGAAYLGERPRFGGLDRSIDQGIWRNGP